MQNLFASGAAALLGLALTWLAGLAEPAPTQEPTANRKDQDVLKKAEVNPTEADGEPTESLRRAYDLLRRLRSEPAGVHLNDQPQQWTTRAVRLYRDAIGAYEKGDLRHAQALSSAALQLARAVEFARNAERAERDDADLPPPPPSARLLALYRTADAADEPAPALPPPLDEGPQPGGALPRVRSLAPPAPPRPGRPAEPARPVRPPALPALPAEPGAAPLPPRQLGAPPRAVEELERVRLRLREVARDDPDGDRERTRAAEEKLRDLRERLAELERSLAGATRSAANAQARRDLRRAYDRIRQARAQHPGADAGFYLDAARDLYNAARRDAEAGRNDRASELARAAEALTLVPRHLSSLPARRDQLRLGIRREEPPPDDAVRDRAEPGRGLTLRRLGRNETEAGPPPPTQRRLERRVERKDQPGENKADELRAEQPSIVGIGVALGSEDDAVVVQEILPDGPAEKDGRLKVGDEIVGMETDDGKTVEFKDKGIAEVARLLRGPEGTKVKLVVKPKDSDKREVYELKRAKLKITTGPRRPEGKDDPSSDEASSSELPPPLID